MSDILLMVVEHLPYFLIGQIALEMLHRLSREVIEKIRVRVVRDVIEVDQATDDIVFHPWLTVPIAADGHGFALIRVKVVGPEFL
jgi:hypothetical protein